MGDRPPYRDGPEFTVRAELGFLGDSFDFAAPILLPPLDRDPRDDLPRAGEARRRGPTRHRKTVEAPPAQAEPSIDARGRSDIEGLDAGRKVTMLVPRWWSQHSPEGLSVPSRLGHRRVRARSGL
jgi:hypothetical protein